MGISVSYFGKTQPGKGAKPVKTFAPPKLPFGQKAPVNFWTGKHVALNKDEAADSGSGNSTSGNSTTSESQIEIEYSRTTHILRYRRSPTSGWITIDTAVPDLNEVEP